MAEQRLIVVTGATGRQGGAVARHLLADEWTVRAITRDPGSEAARALANAGAEVMRADMGDPVAMRATMVGAYGVYSVQNHMISGLDAEIEQGKNVADAAADAGVQHFVYGSAGTGEPGTGVGSWESKLVVEQHIDKLGLPMTVLRPMALMELMSDKTFYPAVGVWHMMPKLMGEDRPVPWLSVDDLGAIAAKVFADPERFIGADLKLASDTRTIAECRKIWRDVTGRLPRRFPMPVRLFERFVGTDLTTMWRWLKENPTPLDTARTLDLHPGARTVRQWAEDQHAP